MQNNNHQEMTKEELQQILEQVREEFRAELKQSLADLEQRMDQKMDQKIARMESVIIRWTVGLFLGTAVVMGTLVGTYTMMVATRIPV